MTLTQLDYIIAIDTYRHFSTAAEHCHVTQPTLSMQIQKLEDELGVLLFDRSKQPVVPTDAGALILAQARDVAQAARRIPELARESQNDLSGELRLGIIPTLAPYLLPYFLTGFLQKYPAVNVQIQEITTEPILEQLRTGLLDVGIVVTPLTGNGWTQPGPTERGPTEIPLFQEPFVVYAAESHPLFGQPTVSPNDLHTDGLWLLTEGHCFRNQVMNLCGADTRVRRGAGQLLRQPVLQPGQLHPTRLRYETGSLETLIKLIDKQDGFTLLPYLATLDLPVHRQARLRSFSDPQPMREVSLVAHRSFVKRKLINALQHEIIHSLPPGVVVDL